MLSIFRRGVTAKIMLVILGIGLFAIVVTGFGTGGGGLGDMTGQNAGTIVSVGDEQIGTRDVTRQVNRQVERAQQERPDFDVGAFVRAGLLDQTIDQMVSLAAAIEFAREQGISASRAMIDGEIARIPAFRNLAGQFDQAVFEQALAREKMSAADLRREVERELIQRQLMLPAAGAPFVPEKIAHQYASLLLESRTGMIGVVPTGAMAAGKEPTDAEVAAFYQKNIGRYTVPERRAIRYAVFGRDNVAAAAKATDAEIQAAYRENAATYSARETRVLSQVVLPDEAAAKAFAQKVAGGTAFTQAAQQAGFGAADIAVGEQTKEAYARLSSAPVANAAFGAAKGATVGPIRGPIGWHVVRVDDVKTTAARPLAAVRGELAARIEQQKAGAALGDLAGRIENAVGDGATFDEVVQREKLTVHETPPLTSGGLAPGAPGWQAPAEVRPLLQPAFEVEPNSEPLVETLVPDQVFALFTVSNVVPAAAPPLAQIRDRVKADLAARNASERAKAVAASIASKINAGTPPAQAFAEAAVKLPAVQNVTAVRREISRQGQVPPPLAMLFSLPRGKARTMAAPNGQGWFVVYLQNVVPGDASKEPGMTQAVRSQFGEIMSEEYWQQLTAAAKTRIKVKRNEDALKRLKQDLGGAGQ
jgi:peptidyl-prolyl cis-trans isomerase D